MLIGIKFRVFFIVQKSSLFTISGFRFLVSGSLLTAYCLLFTVYCLLFTVQKNSLSFNSHTIVSICNAVRKQLCDHCINYCVTIVIIVHCSLVFLNLSQLNGLFFLKLKILVSIQTFFRY